MKAVVSKKTGEVLLFCEQSEVDLLKNIKDILVMDAVPCKCGHGWLVKRKREKHEND